MASAEPDALAQVRALDAALAHVENALLPVLETPQAAFAAALSRTEQASLNVSLAFAASSLFHVLLKARGAPVANHPVRAELDRVKVYMKRVREKVQEEGAAALFKPDAKPALRVDQAASHRMITAALSGEANGAPAKRKSAGDAGAPAARTTPRQPPQEDASSSKKFSSKKQKRRKKSTDQ
ncbi:hypothetical protein M885DRAFT_509431 [Pelagophyceae sp. CCMP2097]|nr:hypothetical protein M885DRAFT_509431 [Pelagophyceae sp. CCMP2097]